MNKIFRLAVRLLVRLSILASLLCNKLLVLWILIEVSAFFLIYVFLKNHDNSKTRFSSFIFYLSKGIRSIFIISGAYLNKRDLIMFGLKCKFFIFPFSILLFYIFENCRWSLIFITGRLFKGLLLCLSYLIKKTPTKTPSLSCILTLIVCMIFIGLYRLKLKGMWFVIKLRRRVVLFIRCVSLSKDVIFVIFALYLILRSVKVYCLSTIKFICKIKESLQDKRYSANYLLTMVAFPISLNLIYKVIGVIICLKSSTSLFLISWCVYLCVETGFLILYFSKTIENFSVRY